MTIPKADYHMHTPLCGHAQGEPSQYAQQAIKVGLEEIGFSDHAPLVSHEDPSITMSYSQVSQYQEMMEKVRKEFAKTLSIKIGLEADFILGYAEKTKEIIEAYPYDFVIGSVHFIGPWAFDNPYEIKTWDNKNVAEVYYEYYELLRQSAQSGLFNIMGHVDLVKKFGHRPSQDLTEELRKTAKVFKDSGVVVEINTAGLRKPVKEIYPSLEALKIFQQAGVLITFGSDAHDPKEVGKDFDKALILAQEAGYKEYVLFKKRKIERKVQL